VLEGKGLTLDYNGSKWELTPQDETTFSTPGPSIRFRLDEQGGMTLTIAGLESADTVGIRKK
jgi:hypothetical protein